MKRALILSGGGARAAYQAGVLKAIAELVPPGTRNPFRTSSAAPRPEPSTPPRWHPVRTTSWAPAKRCAGCGPISPSTAFIAPEPGLCCASPGAGHSPSWAGGQPSDPWLCSTIRRSRSLWPKPYPGRRSAQNLDLGVVDVLAITASSYDSGLSVSFCMGAEDIPMWERAQRLGVRTADRHRSPDGLSAIPFCSLR